MNDPLTIPAALDRRPLIHTYTNLHTYADICPHQYYRRYITKDFPFVGSPQSEWGNKVHEAFELRIGGGKQLPLEMQQWEQFAKPFEGRDAKCEMKVAITAKAQPCDYWDNKTVWLRGKLDTTLLNGQAAFIADWKTGNSKYEDPYELAIGAMMLKVRYPDLKLVKGAYVWLKENRQGQVYDLSDFKATWVRTNNIVKSIEDDRAKRVFEKRRSGLCGFCPVEDCENHYVAEKK